MASHVGPSFAWPQGGFVLGQFRRLFPPNDITKRFHVRVWKPERSTSSVLCADEDQPWRWATHNATYFPKPRQVVAVDHSTAQASATSTTRSVSGALVSSSVLSPRSIVLKMPEGSISWARSNYYFPSSLSAVFEGLPRSKRAWIDPVKCYCYLCEEPVSNMLTHACWWDHVTLHWTMRHLSSVFRQWDPTHVLHVAKHTPAFSSMITRTRRNPHPNSPWGQILQLDKSDEIRRMELAALLRSLNRPPFNCITFSFRDYRSGAVGQGERMFRSEVSRIWQTMVPPCSAECMTRFQQKCWGRKNLEILFDRLQLGKVMEECGVEPATKKDHKGAIMRQVFLELNMALSDADTALAASAHDDDADASVSPPCLRPAATFSDDAFRDVRQMLVEQTLHRIAFELIYLRSMVLFESASKTWMALGPPTNDDIEHSGYY